MHGTFSLLLAKDWFLLKLFFYLVWKKRSVSNESQCTVYFWFCWQVGYYDFWLGSTFIILFFHSRRKCACLKFVFIVFFVSLDDPIIESLKNKMLLSFSKIIFKCIFLTLNYLHRRVRKILPVINTAKKKSCMIPKLTSLVLVAREVLLAHVILSEQNRHCQGKHFSWASWHFDPLKQIAFNIL